MERGEEGGSIFDREGEKGGAGTTPKNKGRTWREGGTDVSNQYFFFLTYAGKQERGIVGKGTDGPDLFLPLWALQQQHHKQQEQDGCGPIHLRL